MVNVGSSKPPRVPGIENLGDLLTPTDRDRILQAMADCCARRGYLETTVEEVIERAAVPRETFDSHFSDKEDCAVAALNKISSETLTTVSIALMPAQPSEVDRLLFGIRAILELMAASPSFARLAYIEARQGATPRMYDAYDSATRVLALMMERLQEKRIGKAKRPAAAARAALGAAEAVVRREIAAGRTEQLPLLLPSLVYTALTPLAGQEEALRQTQRARELLARGE